MRANFLIVALSVFANGFSDVLAREWTDVTGKYHVEAELAGVIAGTVRLKTSDGRTIEVPIEKLSEADRQYIDSLRRSGTKPTRPTSPKMPKPTTRPRVDEPTGIRTGRAAIEKALLLGTNCDFSQTPLADVVDYLEERHRIEFYIDRPALDDVGMPTDVPVTAKGSDSLEGILDKILPPFDLAWTIRDEVLMITTPEELEAELDTHVYKLVQPVPNFDVLITQIQANVAPKSWDVVGGPGSIEAWPAGAVVVAQTYPVHRQIQKKYAQMIQPIVGQKPKAAPGRPAQGNLRLLNALAQPSACEFVQTPLRDVMDSFAERHKIRIVIDERALDDEGIGTNAPLTCKLGGVKLESALNLILSQYGLAWAVEQHGLTITTQEGAQARLTQVTYDVRDLMAMVRGETDSLLDVVTSTVAPVTWNHVGGPGSITVAAGGGGLFVSQTFRNHREIQRLLDDLRQVHRR